METAIFDADSHLMETPEWLGAFADEGVRDRLGSLGLEGAGAGAAELMASAARPLGEPTASRRSGPRC